MAGILPSEASVPPKVAARALAISSSAARMFRTIRRASASATLWPRASLTVARMSAAKVLVASDRRNVLVATSTNACSDARTDSSVRKTRPLLASRATAAWTWAAGRLASAGSASPQRRANASSWTYGASWSRSTANTKWSKRDLRTRRAPGRNVNARETWSKVRSSFSCGIAARLAERTMSSTCALMLGKCRWKIPFSRSARRDTSLLRSNILRLTPCSERAPRCILISLSELMECGVTTMSSKKSMLFARSFSIVSVTLPGR